MPTLVVPNSYGSLREFNPCHAPADGKFCSTPGSRVPVRTAGSYQRQTPIRVSRIGRAIELILQGKVVEISSTRKFNTVLTKLAAMANDAKARGEKAPNYDLCKVSVKGTNLFCVGKLRTKEYPDGVPRIQMPQFSGKAVPGSPASKLPKSEGGNVDGTKAFIRYLTTKGIRVTEGSIPAARLKASQAELVGANVAGMMTNKSFDPAKEPIFTSRDNYVIDGHHRWASVVGRDAANSRLGKLRMRELRVDAPISEVLKLANEWTKKFGIAAKSGS